MLLEMHGKRATSTVSIMHGKRAGLGAHHARFFVQHRSGFHALVPCNIPCTSVVHHRTTVTGQLIPSCTACKTDVLSTASLRLIQLTYPTTNATTDRARGLEAQ